MTWTLSAFADEAAEDVDGQISAIKAGGLKMIDLRNLDGYNITAVPLDHAKGVKQKLDKAGIAVGMFGSPIGKIDIAEDFSIDAQRLEHLGKLADIFGCRKVRIFSYFNAHNRPMHEWAAETLRRLGALKAQAARLKLQLFHENEHLIFGDYIWRVETIARALRDDAPPGSPKTFATIFDFDNYNQCGMDPWTAWERLRDVTDGFHLKDSDKNCQHTPIGTGAGRAKDILADAIKRGWTGHLANEPHLARSPAIMATGPGGVPNQKLADLSHTECFLVGVRSGNQLLADLKAPLA
jgi:sugar phosphate isomerase/epimerase